MHDIHGFECLRMGRNNAQFNWDTRLRVHLIYKSTATQSISAQKFSLQNSVLLVLISSHDKQQQIRSIIQIIYIYKLQYHNLQLSNRYMA